MYSAIPMIFFPVTNRTRKSVIHKISNKRTETACVLASSGLSSQVAASPMSSARSENQRKLASP
jgi:hypothetical protein